MTRLRQIALCDKHAAEALGPWRPVPMPVDVTDAAAFPEIARAIEWARKQKEARNG